MESSRVRRLTWLLLALIRCEEMRTLTTASCSFSNCKCKSAAVKGRGCLNGPGPLPTPVLSPAMGPAAPVAVVVGIFGEAKGGDDV